MLTSLDGQDGVFIPHREGVKGATDWKTMVSTFPREKKEMRKLGEVTMLALEQIRTTPETRAPNLRFTEDARITIEREIP